MFFKSFWFSIIAKFCLVTIFCHLGVKSQSADMSKFKSLISEETCIQFTSYLNYDTIGSLFMWDKHWHMFFDEKHGANTFEWRYEKFDSKSRSKFETEPIYGIKFMKDSWQRYKLVQNEHRALYEQYLQNYNVTYYYTWDYTTMLFIIDLGKEDVMVPYNYLAHEDRTVKILANQSITKGTIPLLHLFDEQSVRYLNRNVEVPTTLVNNQHYTYQTGWIKLEPASFKVDHTYYYGFNRELDRIYFARSFKRLEQISHFLHPSKVVGVKRWHPFRCYDYVYLQAGDWVFIFPHLNLTEMLPKYPNRVVLQASMSVMHLYTMFRCTEKSDLPSIPVYPSKKFSVYNFDDSTNQYDEFSTKDHDAITIKLTSQSPEADDILWIILVVLLILILVLVIVIVIYIRNLPFRKKNILSGMKLGKFAPNRKELIKRRNQLMPVDRRQSKSSISSSKRSQSLSSSRSSSSSTTVESSKKSFSSSSFTLKSKISKSIGKQIKSVHLKQLKTAKLKLKSQVK